MGLDDSSGEAVGTPIGLVVDAGKADDPFAGFDVTSGANVGLAAGVATDVGLIVATGADVSVGLAVAAGAAIGLSVTVGVSVGSAVAAGVSVGLASILSISVLYFLPNPQMLHS